MRGQSASDGVLCRGRKSKMVDVQSEAIMERRRWSVLVIASATPMTIIVTVTPITVGRREGLGWRRFGVMPAGGVPAGICERSTPGASDAAMSGALETGSSQILASDERRQLWDNFENASLISPREKKKKRKEKQGMELTSQRIKLKLGWTVSPSPSCLLYGCVTIVCL